MHLLGNRKYHCGLFANLTIKFPITFSSSPSNHSHSFYVAVKYLEVIFLGNIGRIQRLKILFVNINISK